MFTFQDLYTHVQDITKNTDSTQLTKFKLWINQGYHKLLGAARRWTQEETDLTTLDTVADQQFYSLPVHYLRMKSVVVDISDVKYPLIEVKSQLEWDEINAYQTTTSDIPTHYFLRRNKGVNQVGLFPTPATADYDIEVVFERRMKDLTADDYTAGTVGVTNGDETVTGTSTTFTAFMADRIFKTTNDGNWYYISSFTSATSIELAIPFEGATVASGASYTIGEAPFLPEDFQITPAYYALQKWFEMEKDVQNIALYKGLFEDDLKKFKTQYGSKTSINVLGRRPTRRYVHPHRPLTITLS
jgi:hypothetical protein